jgi:NAD(P)-dependent dehydrogenase (short-subunit alcohol dehydrogenase family)
VKPAGSPRIMDVRGKRVLVTAGASGIGRAIAEELSAGGADVHITDVAETALGEALSAVPRLSGTVGDATDAAHADRVLADVKARFDGLDVLINNVGIAGPTGRVETYDEADVERTIDVNLNSHFRFLARFVPLLRESKRDPSIIEISSVAGRLGYPYRTPYAATKWAIIGLIKSLAIELGPDGIRANVIMPGPVDGPRMDNVIAARAQAVGETLEEARAAYLNKASLRRMVNASDIACLALFLSSDLARNITGQAISVDANIEYL